MYSLSSLFIKFKTGTWTEIWNAFYRNRAFKLNVIHENQNGFVFSPFDLRVDSCLKNPGFCCKLPHLGTV